MFREPNSQWLFSDSRGLANYFAVYLCMLQSACHGEHCTDERGGDCCCPEKNRWKHWLQLAGCANKPEGVRKPSGKCVSALWLINHSARTRLKWGKKRCGCVRSVMDSFFNRLQKQQSVYQIAVPADSKCIIQIRTFTPEEHRFSITQC